jgi:hypothetical protein
LTSAASIFAALANIALPGITVAGMMASSANITLTGKLLYSKCRIICLQLLSPARVYATAADMRR